MFLLGAAIGAVVIAFATGVALVMAGVGGTIVLAVKLVQAVF